MLGIGASPCRLYLHENKLNLIKKREGYIFETYVACSEMFYKFPRMCARWKIFSQYAPKGLELLPSQSIWKPSYERNILVT